MRIVVDLQSCQSGSHLGGIGRFSMSLLKAMIECHRDHDYIILLNEAFPARINAIRSELRNHLPPANFVSFPSPRGSSFASGHVELRKSAEYIRESIINGLSPDVVHVGSLVEGEKEDIVTSIGHLPDGPPTAVTFHDLIPLTSRDIYLRNPNTRAFYFEKIRLLLKADALLANSQFVADEGRRILTTFKGVITTIGGGVASNFVKLPSREGFSGLRRKFNIDRKFILYTSSFDQRKNQSALIEAFARIAPEKRQGHVLVISGDGSDYIYERLRNVAADAGLEADELVFTGRVSDEDLVLLYNACDLFVFPSKEEGLGLPVLEAMACGVPVIGSGTSSLVEVLGSPELMFDPLNPQDIAEKMLRGLFDPEFRAAAIAQGARQAKAWSWEAAAGRAIGALGSLSAVRRTAPRRESVSDQVAPLIRGEDLVEADLGQTIAAIANADMFFEKPWESEAFRIGWVTTWGTRCGIATYSSQLLQKSGAQVTVFAAYSGDSGGDAEPHGIAFERCWAKGKPDYLIELSDAVEKASVDALHIQFNYGLFNLVSLNSFILSQVRRGMCVFITLHSTTDDPNEPDSQLSNLRHALAFCSRIFVHSIHDVGRLSAIGISENVVLIPHGVGHVEVRDRPRSSDGGVLATYGFALPGKGLHEIVQAFAELKRQDLAHRLLLVNADYGDSGGDSFSLIQSLRALASQLNLGDSIEFHNAFLPDEDSIALLARANIVVYPYTRSGESGSGAVRLGLLSGAAVATTPLSIFDDVGEAVHQLPGTSVPQITQGLRDLLGKIRRHDLTLRKQETMRAALIESTRYAQVAKLLDSQCREALYKNGFVEVLRMNTSRVSLIKGRLTGQGITGTGKGVVCYGPYEPIQQGVYRLVVKGLLSDSKSEATVRVNCGDALLGLNTLTPAEDGVLCHFAFVCPYALGEVEVVVEWDGVGDLAIDDYRLLKKW